MNKIKYLSQINSTLFNFLPKTFRLEFTDPDK